MSSEHHNNAILAMSDIAFSYEREKPLINNLSLSLYNKEFVGLLGPNGSGKSTVLKLASGILTPGRGTIQLWEKPLLSYKNRDRAKLICYLPQLLDMHIPFTVKELVSMGLYPYDIKPEMSVIEALRCVDLTEKAEQYIEQLSGGERRRAFLAMTLLQGAGILLLDEPFANLDIRYQAEIVTLLHNLRSEKNISMLMALHDVNIASRFDKIILMKQGHVLASGTPADVLKKNLLKEAFDVDLSIIEDHTGKRHIYYEMDSFR